MQHNFVKNNFNKIESIISNKKYNLINWAFNIIEQTKSYKEKNQKLIEKQLLLEKQRTKEAKAPKKKCSKRIL